MLGIGAFSSVSGILESVLSAMYVVLLSFNLEIRWWLHSYIVYYILTLITRSSAPGTRKSLITFAISDS